MNILSKDFFEKEPKLKLVFAIILATAILFFVGYTIGKGFYYYTH